MANSQIDRLSDLNDALLLTILSFLPTHIAARTSVLSRQFRHLWEASPSLDLISRDLPHPSDNFTVMAERALLSRNPSHHLLSLRIEDSFHDRSVSSLSPLLAKARSLNLRHLTIDLNSSNFLHILPIIFTINSLKCLSLDITYHPFCIIFPSETNLTCLRSLSLKLYETDPTNLNRLLSELCSLEDLHLDLKVTPGVILLSQSIRKLKLIITGRNQRFDIVELSLPGLKSLHLEIRYSIGNLSHIHAVVPLLRKAVINLHNLHERDVSVVARLLNCISHVEELSLHLKDSTDVKYPIPILLESGKDVPIFSNLKHLDVTLCFHEHNFEAVTRMLRNCPVLKSLKLVHEFSGCARGRKRKDWGSRLPRNADGNYRCACFENLHLEENRKEVIKLLSKKCPSKRQPRN